MEVTDDSAGVHILDRAEAERALIEAEEPNEHLLLPPSRTSGPMPDTGGSRGKEARAVEFSASAMGSTAADGAPKALDPQEAGAFASLSAQVGNLTPGRSVTVTGPLKETAAGFQLEVQRSPQWGLRTVFPIPT
jgi:hypothetical protein